MEFKIDNKITGIYCITNKVNNKRYIGQSENIKYRWFKHRTNKNNTAINKAIRSYGIDSFGFSILLECPIEDLNKNELYYIELYSSVIPNGYNNSISDYNRATKTTKAIVNPKEYNKHMASIRSKYYTEKPIDRLKRIRGIKWFM